MSVNREKLWQFLKDHALVKGDLPVTRDLESPWYVRSIVGFSGWLAAGFMLGFIFAGLGFVFRHSTVMRIMVGGIMLEAAGVMMRAKRGNDFVAQFALAISFAGQFLVIIGISDITHTFDGRALFCIGLLQAALAWFMPSNVHRVWSSFAAAMAMSLALADAEVFFIQSGLILAAVVYLWLNEFKWAEYNSIVKPWGYGLTWALFVHEGTTVFYRLIQRMTTGGRDFDEGWFLPWMGEVLIGAVMLVVVWQLLQRQNLRIPSRIANAALTGTVLLIVASLQATGITVGIVIILLGYANGNRILAGMGMVSLLFYLSSYYYMLDTTLLAKAQLLATVGLALLLANWAMHYWLMTDKEANHA